MRWSHRFNLSKTTLYISLDPKSNTGKKFMSYIELFYDYFSILDKILWVLEYQIFGFFFYKSQDIEYDYVLILILIINH